MKIKVLEQRGATRDCTVGKEYEAIHLEQGSLTVAGGVVDNDNGYQFTDDVDDIVTIDLSFGDAELVEE